MLTHDPSEIILICWFGAHETFLIIINTEKSCAALYVMLFSGFFDGKRIANKKKEQRLIEIEIFCNIINVFAVTFHASLLSKMIHLFTDSHWPQTFKW